MPSKFKGALTENFTAEIASGINFHEYAHIIYQTSTANIAYKVIYMKTEVRIHNGVLCTAPHDINIG